MERIALSGEEVYRILSGTLHVRPEDYVVLVAIEKYGSPFLLLVSIILSQNTNDKNAIVALEEYVARIGPRPEDAVEAGVERVAEAIRKAGLQEQKARAIVELARRLIEAGGERVLDEMDPWKLREWLLEIPGVGPKTVDVFLAVYRRVPVFAVDTHARRIAERWGLVRRGAGYEEVSRALLDFFGPERAEEAHRLLIALGRTYCRARNPRCEECPLRSACPYALQRSSRRSPGESGGR